MKEKHNRINRRNFLKTMGAVSLAPAFTGVAGAVIAAEPNAPTKGQKTKFPQVPRRKLGRTGVKVPCLSLGAAFDIVENQIVLRKALEWGVDYWDSAHNYAGGNSELGIGKFLSKNPKLRKKLFIVTKSSIFGETITTKKLQERFETSLKRMNTNYVDLYCGVHGLSNPADLTDELKQWAENAKKQKLIRFFGFSTHSNMAECLAAAARRDWIDVVMTTYNFRVMQDEKLQEAIEACHKAGIGLLAMKTQAQKVETEEDKELTKHFLQRGFTEGQAKVKIVLEDKRFSSACVGRNNVAHLMLNIAVALDETKLTRADKDFFKEHARATCSGYCAGCADICNSALPEVPCVSDIMRYLMYYNSYGDREGARELFAKIPSKLRNKLLSTDYRIAEAHCPQHLPISQLIAEAVSKLA